MAETDVALLGAGKIGVALADRWAAGGRSVTVWNRTPDRAEALTGDHVVAETDLATAVTRAPVVVAALTDGAAVRSVLVDDGALAAMHPGSTVMDLSTIDVPSSEAVAEEAAARGVRYVRGAVSGTAAVVAAGNAGLLLSGPADAVATVQPLLDDVTGNQVVVGEREEARVVKLATNMLLAGTMQALAEAVVMAEASGVTRETVLEALDSTVVASPFLGYKGKGLAGRDYAPTFTTADMRKDMELAIDQAARTDVPLAVTEAIRDQLAAACDEGWAGDDFASVVRVVQQRAGRPVDE